jgi:hypothetical protein
MIIGYDQGMIFRRKHVVEPEMITVPKADYLALCDSVTAERASRVLGDQSVLPVAQRGSQGQQPLSAAQLELILEAHYREVLSSKEGRRMWRKLLGDAAAAERLNLK